MTALQQRIERLQTFFTRSIWKTASLADRSVRGRLIGVLRVITMTCSGVMENSLASRAGALSYSSMLALGPLIILVVVFSGSVLERTEDDFALEHLNRALLFVAPQLAQLKPIGPDDTPVPGVASGTEMEPTGESLLITSINPELAAMLQNLVGQSHAKTIGTIGIVSLIVIVVQLFTSIENAFNGIWGVRRGRNWIMRIAYHWAAVTLGAVLLAALAALSASAFIATVDAIPILGEAWQLFAVATPLVSGLVLVGLLMLFYKFIPNTSVGWLPALSGAAIVVVLIHLNNTLAFLYIRSVSLNLSIYGGLGVLAVMMLALYVFWLFLLVGGQITYAVQNAQYRGSSIAWADLNHTARMGLAVLVLALVARRFRACQEAFTADQIAEIVKIPIQILNACFHRLIQLGVISRIPSEDAKAGLDYRFQPARPLNSITLAEFKELFEDSGEGPDPDILGTIDPVVHTYYERSRAATHEALGSETLEELLTRLPAAPVTPTGR